MWSTSSESTSQLTSLSHSLMLPLCPPWFTSCASFALFWCPVLVSVVPVPTAMAMTPPDCTVELEVKRLIRPEKDSRLFTVCVAPPWGAETSTKAWGELCVHGVGWGHFPGTCQSHIQPGCLWCCWNLVRLQAHAPSFAGSDLGVPLHCLVGGGEVGFAAPLKHRPSMLRVRVTSGQVRWSSNSVES